MVVIMINKKPVRKEYVTCCNIGDEAILYDSTMKLVHVVNTTACFIWNMCDGLHQINDIIEALENSFDVSTEYNIHEDIQKIFQSFYDKDLISFGEKT
jgi:Coenzyme PQQ synthesis protein D (PqqD).